MNVDISVQQVNKYGRMYSLKISLKFEDVVSKLYNYISSQMEVNKIIYVQKLKSDDRNYVVKIVNYI